MHPYKRMFPYRYINHIVAFPTPCSKSKSKESEHNWIKSNKLKVSPDICIALLIDCLLTFSSFHNIYRRRAILSQRKRFKPYKSEYEHLRPITHRLFTHLLFLLHLQTSSDPIATKAIQIKQTNSEYRHLHSVTHRLYTYILLFMTFTDIRRTNWWKRFKSNKLKVSTNICVALHIDCLLTFFFSLHLQTLSNPIATKTVQIKQTNSEYRHLCCITHRLFTYILLFMTFTDIKRTNWQKQFKSNEIQVSTHICVTLHIDCLLTFFFS